MQILWVVEPDRNICKFQMGYNKHNFKYGAQKGIKGNPSVPEMKTKPYIQVVSRRTVAASNRVGGREGYRGLGTVKIRVWADTSSRERPLKTSTSENTWFRKNTPNSKRRCAGWSSGSRCWNIVSDNRMLCLLQPHTYWSAGRLLHNDAINGKGRRKQDFADEVSDQDTDLTSMEGKRSTSRFGQQEQNTLWFWQSLSRPKDSKANNSC